MNFTQWHKEVEAEMSKVCRVVDMEVIHEELHLLFDKSVPPKVAAKLISEDDGSPDNELSKLLG